jgi:hypothetical protein
MEGIAMRAAFSVIALAALAAAGCATQKTYETVLDVCSSGNGTVKSAKVLKSSGDAQIDQHAIEKVGTSMVYEESASLTCRPLTVEYKVAGEA